MKTVSASPAKGPGSTARLSSTGFDDSIRLTRGETDQDQEPPHGGEPGRLAALAPASVDDGGGVPDETPVRPGPEERPLPRGTPGGRRDVGDRADDQQDTNLDRPRAQRRGEGGGPTRSMDEKDESEEGEEFKSDLLVRVLGLEDSPVTAFGWVQGGITGNPAHPRNDTNFGVNPNFAANDFNLQQLYFVVEKPLRRDKPGDYDYGFRLDNLFGTDWAQFHMVGLFDGAFTPNKFGYEPTQFYGEVHLPWLTPGGIDVKGGRFFSLGGYEDTLAPSRPLNSTSYLFSYAHPFTHFGMMSIWHVTDRINLYNGAVNGWDRWINAQYRWGYAGGLSMDSQDSRTNLTVTLNAGPNQFPRFFGADYKLAPNGVPQPPFLAGRRNLLYNKNHAFLLTSVLIHQWTDALTVVGEADYARESNIPGLGPGGTATNGEWYGAAGWLLYRFRESITGVVRADVFRDQNGTRTGYDNLFYEATLGLILKPRSWFWVRPEVRYDGTDGYPAYNDERSHHQITYGFDAIFLF